MKKNTIGKRIAEARINLNITQEQLEELSGFSVSTISRFETGRTQPSIENLIKLSKVLNVGIDYFLKQFRAVMEGESRIFYSAILKGRVKEIKNSMLFNQIPEVTV